MNATARRWGGRRNTAFHGPTRFSGGVVGIEDSEGSDRCVKGFFVGDSCGAVGIRLREVPKLERPAGAPCTCSQRRPGHRIRQATSTLMIEGKTRPSTARPSAGEDAKVTCAYVLTYRHVCSLVACKNKWVFFKKKASPPRPSGPCPPINSFLFPHPSFVWMTG